MPTSPPHVLLFSEADSSRSVGRWHFLVESVQGETMVEAADDEPGVHGERLELLAVVRGLESLHQPSRVTLLTTSRHVSRGLRVGLEEWRGNRWCWERDGRLVPIKNQDLWQRIDWAMKFHQVECRSWRIDAAHAVPEPRSDRVVAHGGRARRWVRWGQRMAGVVRRWWSLPGAWPSLGTIGTPAT